MYKNNLLRKCKFDNPRHIFHKLSQNFNSQLIQFKFQNTLVNCDAKAFGIFFF